MIKEEMIFVGGELKSKGDIITFLSKQAQECGLVSDWKEFEGTVLDREAQVSTSVGYSIAMPHGKAPAVKEAFVTYYRAKEEFEWDSETKDVVHSIFMIGVPSVDGDKTHLRYISKISKKLIDESFRTQLFECTERGQAFRLLNLINKEL